MNNNYYSRIQLLQLLLLPLISSILCINPEDPPEATQNAREELESEEFENSLVNNVQTENRNGFVELLNFIDSMNGALTARSAAQDNEFATLNAKIDAQRVEFNAQFSALNSQIDRLTTTANNLLKKAIRINSTWEDFDVLIRTQAEEIKTGKSFNGSTLSEIKSRASQFGENQWHTVVVFVNHLDEDIVDLRIYDKYNTTYNPAPNFIPGRTQEVFTFAHPISVDSEGRASFSYIIPSLDISIAAISHGGAYGAGLAFVSKGTDMKTYYDSRQGIEGSSVWECCEHVDRKLHVGYKNFYARMFADSGGEYKTTSRIELIKFSLDD